MNKYRCSISGGPVRITSTSGHIVLVGEDFVEVPEHMEPDALANGCISEDGYERLREEIKKELLKGNTPPPGPEALTGEQRMEKIISSMNEMLNSSNTNYFTAAGLPNKKELHSRCGFTTTEEEFTAAWAEVSKTKETPPQT